MNISSTGYWTFICNPSKWEVDKFLETNIVNDVYQVVDWQADYFAPGQLGIIRVGRDTRTKKQLAGKKRLLSGIYAIVQITSVAQRREEEPDNFWVKWTEKEWVKPVVKIKYLKNLLVNPLLLSDLKELMEIQEDRYLISGYQGASIPLSEKAFEKIVTLSDADDVIKANIDTEETYTVEKITYLESKYKYAVPKVKEVISKRIERGVVSQTVKKINQFKCLFCEALHIDPIGFKKVNGQNYIETHHVMPVSILKQGSLGFANLITVCANHHRQIHYGNVELISEKVDHFTYSVDGTRINISKCKVT